MKAICDYCFRHCTVEEGKTGWCRVRISKNGKMESIGLGIAAIADDPIEKKPLYHFLPGTRTLSIGGSGCSLSCDFCQNWTLSQTHVKGEKIDDKNIVNTAIIRGMPSISFTYSEPLVWQEYILSIAPLASESGLRNVMVTSGTFSKQSLEKLLPLIDAYNIDFKGDECFYRNICHGKMEPVIHSIERIASEGRHLEVTTLIIEGIHDEAMIRSMGKMLKAAGVEVWHLTRFYPAYKMDDRNPTSESYLKKLITIAKESDIPYIYPGNSIMKAETHCPACGHVIDRYKTQGRCDECGETIYGIWGC